VCAAAVGRIGKVGVSDRPEAVVAWCAPLRSVANVVRRSWVGGASRVPDGGHRRYRRDRSRGWRLRAVCRVAAVRCDLVALGHVAGLDHLAGQRMSGRPTVRIRQCRTFAKLGRKEQAAPAKPRQGLTSCSSVDA
jgi:hypothetical protein